MQNTVKVTVSVCGWEQYEVISKIRNLDSISEFLQRPYKSLEAVMWVRLDWYQNVGFGVSVSTLNEYFSLVGIILNIIIKNV